MMNLSQVQVEMEVSSQEDLSPKYRAEEARLLNIIESIQEVRATKAWSSLKAEIFDKLVDVLDRELGTEARKNSPDPLKLNRTSGELKWAERFSDLHKLENVYRAQLTAVRKQLYGKTER